LLIYSVQDSLTILHMELCIWPSEEGSFVTGHDLVIDTGITAGRTVQEQAMGNEKLGEVILGVSGG
jgi:hypothetical protein